MEEIKEDFCGACVAGGVALLGAGTAGYSRKDKKKQAMIFWISVLVTVISIIFMIYFLMNCKECA
jgi:hypothetical protein